MKREGISNALLILMVIALPFVHSNQLLDQGLIIRFIILSFFIAALYFLLLFKTIKIKSAKSTKTPILLVFGLLVVYLATRCFSAYVLGDALFEWSKMLILYIILVAVYQLFSYDNIKYSLIWSLSLLGIGLGIWGLIDLVILLTTEQFVIPFSTYDIKAGFEHRNLYVQVLFLTVPFQLLQIFNKKNRFFSWMFSSSFVLSLFLIVILSNRAVWLATSVSFLFFFTLLYIVYKKKVYLLDKFQIIKLVSLAVFAIILAFSFIGINNSTNEIKAHSEEIFSANQGTIDERFELWERTTKLFKESPVFGIGLTNWKIEVLKLSNDGLVTEDHLTFYQRPHNDYLWLLSETGVIGFLIYFVLIGLVLWKAIKLILDKNRSSLFLVMLLVAISGYLVFAFFSFPRERIYHQFLFTLFLGAILLADKAQTKETVPFKNSQSIKVFIPISLALMLAIGLGLVRYKGESNLKKALEAKNIKDYHSVILNIDKASNSLYQMDPTSTPLLWYSGFAFYQLQQFQNAKDELIRAYSLNPYHIHVLNNLGSTYAKINKPDSAIFYYKKALVCAPNFDESWFNMAAVYFNNRDNNNAYEALKKVNLFTNDLRYKPFIKTILRALIIEELSNGDYDPSSVLPDDEEWYFNVHKKLRNDHIPMKNLIFEDQILNPTNPY